MSSGVSVGGRTMRHFIESLRGPESALQKHLKDLMAPYQYPRVIEFVKPDYLPKTRSEKIKRKELRKRELEKMGKK